MTASVPRWPPQASPYCDRSRSASATNSRSTSTPIGGDAIDRFGDPLPEQTRAALLTADAILLGAVGGPKWADPKATVRPEQGLLAMRKVLGVFANVRPLKLHPRTAEPSPLKPERTKGVDIVFIRELTGGIYFGAKTRERDRRHR